MNAGRSGGDRAAGRASFIPARKALGIAASALWRTIASLAGPAHERQYVARTRSARTREPRRQCGEEQTRTNDARVAQVDPMRKSLT
jgi:hypothetical protein